MLVAASRSKMTQCMVRPCVARDFVELAVSGLASMYPAFDWSVLAPGHHGYQRACDLISGPASTGHSGHQCSHAPGRPNLHLVSFSRRPRQVKRVGLHHSALLILLGSRDRSDGGRFVPTFSRSTIKRAGRSPHRSCTPRSFDPAPERSRRCEPACWRPRLRERCGAAASWQLPAMA